MDGLTRRLTPHLDWRALLGHRHLRACLLVLGILVVAQGRNRAVSRLLRAIKKGITAAIASYIEERGGLKLFTLEDDPLPDISPFAHHQTNLFPNLSPSLPSATSDEGAGETVPAPESPDTTCPSHRPLSAARDPVEVVLSSAKLFACMDLEESRCVFDQCNQVVLRPNQQLFQIGDSSESGIFIVFDGELGVFPSKQRESTMFGKLHCGESVGDMDVLDGAPRSVSCAALDTECTLVQVPRSLFMTIILNDPRVLNTYLHRVSASQPNGQSQSSSKRDLSVYFTAFNPFLLQAIARLWRVAHFTLIDFLQLPSATLSESHDGEYEAEVKSKKFALEKYAAKGNNASMLHRIVQPLQGILRSESHLKEGSVQPEGVKGSSSAIVNAETLSKSDGHKRKVSFGEGLIESKSIPSSPVVIHTHQATLAGGWDVVGPEESGLSMASLVVLSLTNDEVARSVKFSEGQILQEVDEPVKSFYIVVEGTLAVERSFPGRRQTESALVVPGSLVNCGAFLTSTRSRATVRAMSQTVHLTSIGAMEIDKLITSSQKLGQNETMFRKSSECSLAESFTSAKSSIENPNEETETGEDGNATASLVVDILLAASRALGPLIRRFVGMGLSRVWLRSGDVIYRQGDTADALYIVISGRARLFHNGGVERGGEGAQAKAFPSVEDDVGRGDSCGAVWALSGGIHDTTCLCIRDLEAVRMSKTSFEIISATYPRAAARVVQGMAKRLAAAGIARRRQKNYSTLLRNGPSPQYHDIFTIAILPAGRMSDTSQHNMAQQLQRINGLARVLRAELEALYGPTTLIDYAALQLMFPREAEHLDKPFFRAKVTTWISQQEEDRRFVILQGGTSVRGDESDAWSCICADQADCVLLVATPMAGVQPEVSLAEDRFLWRGARRVRELMHRAVSLDAGEGDTESEARHGFTQTMESIDAAPKLVKRVELVLLHNVAKTPVPTAPWLDARPLLTRHHHVRLHRTEDVARLGRWMAGTAVGVVLSGGGSRGLAHFGVLRALHDAGVPVDVVGGSSQGAFMAGMYAQDVGWTAMQANVAAYAARLGSIRELVSDLTLPLLSVFSGRGFDRVVKEAFADGPQRIEDLWLPFFCITTNLTVGAPQVHRKGSLWRAVRASSTLIGLVPPVVDEHGHLLCDGGYSDNLPVGAMRDMGVGTVIVVDVEDRDQSAWLNLSPTDGGVSGWQLAWDKICPVPRWRFGIRIPGHAQLINALTWMAHTQNLSRLAQEGHHIDLYLRPPVTQYRLLDYHLIDRIVREATRYAFVAIVDWQRSREPQRTGKGAGAAVSYQSARLDRRAASVSCMTQLQVKAKNAVWAVDDQFVGIDSGSRLSLAPTGGGGGGDGSEDDVILQAIAQPQRTSLDLMAPLQFLQRAATAQPLVEINLKPVDSMVIANKQPSNRKPVVAMDAGSKDAAKDNPQIADKSLKIERGDEEERPPGDQEEENVSDVEQDQFAFLEDLNIELTDDDLPWS